MNKDKVVSTKAVRLYGKDDLRLEQFSLPAVKQDEILARVISDSICMSSYKAVRQGAKHKRVPDNVKQNPVIIGHEFCGIIEQVGQKWQDQFSIGDKFSIQPALNYKGSLDAPGYSFRYIGGNATRIKIPNEVMECGCLLRYDGPGYFPASLAEPMSCIVGAFHASYHTEPGSYIHKMGIKPGGILAILAGAGPMGLGAIDYAIHNPVRPKMLVVTDIDQTRLARAESLITPAMAEKQGVKLIYLNTGKQQNSTQMLIDLSQNRKYNDVFVMAPVKQVVEQADRILARDGCLNFFAGPGDPDFTADLNLYNVHYNSTHLVGTSGGNTDDMKKSLDMMAKGLINPAAMVTHIGGLNAVIETTLNLPHIVGGKKLIYTNISLPLTAISEFSKIAENKALFAELARLTEKNNGIWSLEAEKYLLNNADPI